ncbi:hypothetical protein JoomaDRAFT_1267 [Galbibacter orientalis DSM 19592]|uniref:DUF4230 domain-containing protein n=1 Tax=Galbibacter orientalis DSM 19592 TaxID=926559 RepID=I3C3U0_9FLAO|nr:DUF4230 domain-containing protein [Galbibacter orientalis]EIJ38283.1 hypothetical protein JoomaDRAFT_1267 [Galbibacter orientalis DSM 19592]
MSDILQILLGLLLGILGTYWLVSIFWKRRSSENTQEQSIIILEKIRNVYKLITVEGEFAEIYQYENVREHFLKLISSKKKALLVINAKVNVGFDLKKIEMHADPSSKKIILTSFPEPEVLSIEPDVKYYDIKEGLFNWFKTDDLSTLHSEAKEHILKKIPESGLLESAKKEALDAVLMIENMVQAIGWKLDYKALEIDLIPEKPKAKPKLKKNQV